YVLRLQQPENRVDVERQALFLRGGADVVAVVDDRAGEAIVEVEIADRGDGDVELDRIDPGAELALLDARAQDAGDHGDVGPVHFLDDFRLPEVPRLVQVLAVDEGQELRVGEVIVPGELDQDADRLDRVALVEVEPLLGAADVDEGFLEDGA